VPEITQCPQCQRKLNVPDAQIGQTVRCPLCGEEFTATVLHIQRPPPAVPHEREPLPRGRDDNRRAPAFDAEDYGRRGSRGHNDFRSPFGAVRPHRGGVILALGLIGMFLSFCMVPGWIMGGMAASMGATDLQQMARGTMDESGRGLTKGGQVCGIIALIISTLTFLFACLVNAGRI
jgi:predicted Zn finger-like uncharacterized protein